MTDHASPSSQEFVDAILLTTERECANGEHWCAPTDGEHLKRILAERSRKLGGLIRQAVRLIRLMDRASERNYVEFLYIRIPALRTRFFQQNIDAALARGKLVGIIERTALGVSFNEEEMAASSKAFDLDFAQMPIVGAFIDSLNNMFGFPDVARLCQVIVGPRCTSTAEDLARILSQKIHVWLRERLDNEHYVQQARVIRSFLFDTRRLNADDIDDEAILEFWQKQLKKSDVDGFRMFRSATKKLLVYRESLIVACTENAVLKAVSLPSSPENEGSISWDTLGEANDREEYGGVGNSISVIYDENPWVSPLSLLCTPPASQIKWLTKNDLDFLSDLLPDSFRPEVQIDSQRGDAIFFSLPPDPRFFRTLARYAYFGKLQTNLVDKIKKGGSTGRMPEQDGYVMLRERYREISVQLADVVAATAWSLLQRRHLAGVGLVHAIDPSLIVAPAHPDAETADNIVFLPHERDALVRKIARDLEDSGSALGARLRASFRRINRLGFRPADNEEPEVVDALAAGSNAILALQREVDKVCEWFGRPAIAEYFGNDKKIFHENFSHAHGVEV